MNKNDDNGHSSDTGAPLPPLEDDYASELDPIVGTKLANKYQVHQRIAEGSMGVIYEAFRIDDGERLVVKLLHRSLLGDKSIVGRFEREAKASSLIKHPNCIAIEEG